jgi:DNA-binding MarR family transcriptional regulator
MNSMKKHIEEPGDIDGHSLLAMLRQTHDVILKLRQRELRQYDLTPEQAAALMVIHALGNNATTAEISRRLFRESNSMTVLLRRMEKRGLISKRPDSQRKNIIRISLSKKGLQAYHSSLKIENFNQVISKMQGAQRRQLGSLLELLRNYALEDMKIDIDSYSAFARKLTRLEE